MLVEEHSRRLCSLRFRAHISSHLYDDSGVEAGGVAIYSLSDPRDLREVRYIGQTLNPRRRLLQHWNAARLWLPAERPWWIASPQLRPLYEWIRDLHADEQRLPVMVVRSWVASSAEARRVEREEIAACLAANRPLLNFERQLLGRQALLL